MKRYPLPRTCRRIQYVLAEDGPRALAADAAAQEHLETCDACFQVLESLAELDAVVAELSYTDAPDAVVESLLAHSGLAAPPPANEAPKRRLLRSLAGLWEAVRRPLPRPVLFGAASMATVVIAVVFFRAFMLSREDQRLYAPSPAAAQAPSSEVWEAEEEKAQDAPLASESVDQLRALGYVDAGGVPAEPDPQAASELGKDEGGAFAGAGSVAPEREAGGITHRGGRPRIEPEPLPQDEGERLRRVPRPPPPPPPPPPPAASPAPARPAPALAPRPSAANVPAPDLTLDDVVSEEIVVTSEAPIIDSRKLSVGANVTLSEDDLADLPTARDLSSYLEPGKAGHRDGGDKVDLGDGNLDDGDYDGGDFDNTPADKEDAAKKKLAGRFSEVAEEEAAEPPPPVRQAVEAFWRERSRTEGLSFQAAEGYWANTYVPGDPALRHLAARLRERDREALAGPAAGPLRLHDASRQATLPFDPPSQAALAVYLHADRRRVTGEARTLVQVGLQGTPRYSGRRPAMNVAVVLDLSGEVTAEDLATMRALLAALAEARDLGDRFRLVVAGRPGGFVLGPGRFRHGPITVAMQKLAARSFRGPVLRLPTALEAAISRVAAADDPTQPLGSSAVLLVTAGHLDAHLGELAGLAHRSAVGGVPVSAVGVGDGVRIAELDRLALAGQGNRRLLPEAAAAAALVDRELSAVARVVARAVRLRIRLAPGVRLVDVLGSRRLDEDRAERVREAERSIDRRLSRNFGIAADRGEDEEGIQIVVPSYYAGDTHVVLLDVVVPGPGPVADVTVRFKDLVQMGNGVARAHLELPRGEDVRGPLERSVTKSLLAHRLETALGDAGEYLAAGYADEPAEEIAAVRDLLAGLKLRTPGFDKDRDLARDLAMLDEYLGLLAAVASPEGREHLADSLRYAGRLKVLPRPEAPGGG